VDQLLAGGWTGEVAEGFHLCCEAIRSIWGDSVEALLWVVVKSPVNGGSCVRPSTYFFKPCIVTDVVACGDPDCEHESTK